MLTDENKHIWNMILPKRLRKMYDILQERTRYITLLTEAVDDGHNQAALLRSAESFGVQDVHVVTGKAPFLPAKSISKQAEEWINVMKHPSIRDAIGQLKANGYHIAASHLSNTSVPLENLSFHKPTVLLFGNEHEGVSEEALQYADEQFIVPMNGFMQSLNISVAAAISLYEATQKARIIASEKYYLTKEEQKHIYEQWMMKTLNPKVRELVKAGVITQ
nr:RNA methyltransferase [Salirhabdus salicampi]